MPTHDTGVWLDDDGNVVYEKPEGRSTQLVAPGGEVSAAVRSRIESYGLDDVELPEEEKPEEAPAEEPEAVTTEDVAPKKAPAKRTRKASK